MFFSSISRREFVAAGLGVIPTFVLLPQLRREVCAHGHTTHGPAGPHPTPRLGITSACVPTADKLKATPAAIVAFDEVRQIPQIIDGIRCQCGCAVIEGYYSLLSCYEGEGAMARICEICRGEGRYAFRLHKAGKTLGEIRAAIDDRYG